MPSIYAGEVGLDPHDNTWVLRVGGTEYPLDLTDTLADSPALREGNTVSVLGELAPPAGDGRPRMLIRGLAGHDRIRAEAYEVSRSPYAGSDTDNWLRAQRKLLGV